MKANAPDKIYLTKNLLGELFDSWDVLPSDDFISIEYTRTDAFIDKTAIWLNNNFIVHDEYGVISDSFDTKEKMFEDFVKYMKGE